MKDGDRLGLYLVLSLALARAFGFGLWLIGGPTLQRVALILAVALGLGVLLTTGALFVKAWRIPKTPAPIVERHFYHDGQTKVIERHTIDGTQQKPVLYQLPAQASQPFPDLLRAAWQSGLLSAGQSAEPPVDATADEIPPDPDGWGGDLRP